MVPYKHGRMTMAYVGKSPGNWNELNCEFIKKNNHIHIFYLNFLETSNNNNNSFVLIIVLLFVSIRE